ncbi:hypothetical protein [Symbiopectobacterium sp.]|uniref:hypothetical protein n=1 Tax=Symbiopectobacterium sp. TaxID=2952789 RepID=UPI003F3A316C
MAKNNLTDYEKYGFKRMDIIEILGPDFFPSDDKKQEPTVNAIEQQSDKDYSIENTSSTSIVTEWEPKFANRKHALEIISALSIKLVEKSGNTFRCCDKISANALAETVASILNKPDNQQHRRACT